MSRQALVISVLLALALGLIAAAVLLKPHGGAPGPAAALVAIDPAKVTSIRVENPATREGEIVERTQEGGWTLLLETKSPPAATPWPLIPARVRGLLYTLARLSASGPAQSGATLSPRAITVTISQSGQNAIVLRIDPDSIGGRALVEVDHRSVYFVEDSIASVFASPGPRGWRDTTALPGVGAETSRVNLRTGETELSLARLGGRWFILAPVKARADESSVRGLVRSLTNLTVDRFVDDASAAQSTGLAHPRLMVVAESDRRSIGESGDAKVETDRRTLMVGGPAAIGGDMLFASPGDGRTLFVIPAEGLKGISAEAVAYAAHTASGVLAADVGMIVIAKSGQPDLGFRRSDTGWIRLGDAQQAVEDQAPIEEMLAFLTERIASDVSFKSGPEFRALGTIALFDFESDALQRLEFGNSASGALQVRSAEVAGSDDVVTRTYEGAGMAKLLQ